MTGSNVRHAIISVVAHEPEVNSGPHEASTNRSLLAEFDKQPEWRETWGENQA